MATDEWVLNQKVNGKLYRTYTDAAFAIPGDWALTVTQGASDWSFSLDTKQIPLKDAAAGTLGEQKIQVTTFNLDGQDSYQAEASFTP